MAIETRIELVDISWSSEGDFIINNGDLGDTFQNIGKGFIQEIEDRVKSAFKDWKLLPNRGSDLNEFEGQVNNEDTWRDIELSISLALTRDSFLEQQDFVVTTAPLSNTQIGIRIDFNVALTNIVPDSTITVKVIYDLKGLGPFIIR